MKKEISLCFLFVLLGCSNVEKIAMSNQKIQEIASSSKDKFEEISKETDGSRQPDSGKINKIATQGVLEQTEILEETKNIVQAATGIEDSKPWWVSFATTTMVALSIIGVVFSLWYLGVGHLTRSIFIRLGWISSVKKDQAKLLSDALDSENKTTIQEAVAALRANDKELNEAFKERKKNARKQDN